MIRLVPNTAFSSPVVVQKVVDMLRKELRILEKKTVPSIGIGNEKRCGNLLRQVEAIDGRTIISSYPFATRVGTLVSPRRSKHPSSALAMSPALANASTNAVMPTTPSAIPSSLKESKTDTFVYSPQFLHDGSLLSEMSCIRRQPFDSSFVHLLQWTAVCMSQMPLPVPLQYTSAPSPFSDGSFHIPSPIYLLAHDAPFLDIFQHNV